MSRDALQGFLRLGFFIGGCGLVMIFLQRPGTAEYVLSVCSTLMGAALILGVIVLIKLDFTTWLARIAARRSPPPEDRVPLDLDDSDRDDPNNA
jgi:hypothetical protein